MNKIIIKVLPAEGSNPDFAPEQKLQEGIECAGAALLTFDEDGDLEYTMIHDLSGEKIQNAIMMNKNEEAMSLLRQSFVVAEGFIKASEIFRESRNSKANERFSKIVERIMQEPEEDEEDDAD